MSATTIQATINDVDLPTIQQLFKMLKIKTTILEKKEDDSLMTKEAYFAMIDKSRASKATPVTIDELRERFEEEKKVKLLAAYGHYEDK